MATNSNNDVTEGEPSRCFRSIPDGEWDWDNYSMIVLSQRKDLPLSTMAAVKFNVWCALGNTVHVVHSHLLKVSHRRP